MKKVFLFMLFLTHTTPLYAPPPMQDEVAEYFGVEPSSSHCTKILSLLNFEGKALDSTTILPQLPRNPDEATDVLTHFRKLIPADPDECFLDLVAPESPRAHESPREPHESLVTRIAKMGRKFRPLLNPARHYIDALAILDFFEQHPSLHKALLQHLPPAIEKATKALRPQYGEEAPTRVNVDVVVRDTITALLKQGGGAPAVNAGAAKSGESDGTQGGGAAATTDVSGTTKEGKRSPVQWELESEGEDGGTPRFPLSPGTEKRSFLSKPTRLPLAAALEGTDEAPETEEKQTDNPNPKIARPIEGLPPSTLVSSRTTPPTTPSPPPVGCARKVFRMSLPPKRSDSLLPLKR